MTMPRRSFLCRIAAFTAAAAWAKRVTSATISARVSGSGVPKRPPGSASGTADGALGCGLTSFGVCRPAWLSCTQSWLPPAVPAAAQRTSAAAIPASGVPATTTLPGRSRWSGSMITLPVISSPAPPSAHSP